jgi:hypothetical protein
MGYLGVLFLAGVAMFYALRLRWCFKTRAEKKTRGGYRGGAGLGNALQTLQVFVQPQTEHVIALMLEESVDKDEEGDPKDQTAHLLRQAKRIQKGEKIDRLTALLPP